MHDEAFPADLIVESVNDAVIVLDAQQRIKVWNHAAEQIYGWTKQEVLDQPLADVIPTIRYLDGSSPEQVVSTFYDQGFWRGKVIQPHRDGHPLTIAVSVRLLRHTDGTPNSLIAINRDLTEQEHVEERLHASKAQFEAQYQGIPVPTTTWQHIHGDFVLISVNRAALDWTHGKVHSMFGRQASVTLHDPHGVEADMARSYTEQTVIQRELWWTLRSTGERRYLLNSYSPVPPDLLLIHSMDLTARREAEEALAQQFQRLQHILDIAPVAMAVFDRTMRFMAHSRKWLDTYGPPGQTLIGHRLQDFIPNFPGNWTEVIARALAGETVSRREETWQDPHGTSYTMSWAMTPWYATDATIGGIAIAVDDISELVTARDTAEQASRAKSGFLRSMSHELRTPLQTILGFANLLSDELATPEHQEYVSYIMSAGDQLLTLINDVLDITRIERGRLEVTLEPTSIVQVVTEAVALVQRQALEKGVQIDVRRVQDEQVVADPQRLRQVLVNLLSNAVKYNMDAGRVQVICTRMDRCVRVSVEDTGPGIPEELLSRLFTPFDRLGAETSAIGGIGLGLALSKQLMEHMGGAIGVESRVGQGSTFWIDIPALG